MTNHHSVREIFINDDHMQRNAALEQLIINHIESQPEQGEDDKMQTRM